VNLDPTIGSEIQKERPCVVVGNPDWGRPGMVIVVPLTSWQPKFAKCLWMIKIKNNQQNGLSNPSSADASQIRSLSRKRFRHPIGKITAVQMREIVSAVLLCIGYEGTYPPST
jgi:mRNA interferase MazF